MIQIWFALKYSLFQDEDDDNKLYFEDAGAKSV